MSVHRRFWSFLLIWNLYDSPLAIGCISNFSIYLKSFVFKLTAKNHLWPWDDSDLSLHLFLAIIHWLGTFLYNIDLLFIFCIFFTFFAFVLSLQVPWEHKAVFFFFFLAALGLGCCKWAFSGCSEWASLAVVSLVAELSSRVLPSVVTAQDSVVVVYQLSCPAACGIFLDQGSNPCPLHWQADS